MTTWGFLGAEVLSCPLTLGSLLEDSRNWLGRAQRGVWWVHEGCGSQEERAPDISLSQQAWTPLDRSTPKPAWRSAWTLEMPSSWRPSTRMLTVSVGVGGPPRGRKWAQQGLGSWYLCGSGQFPSLLSFYWREESSWPLINTKPCDEAVWGRALLPGRHLGKSCFFFRVNVTGPMRLGHSMSGADTQACQDFLLPSEEPRPSDQWRIESLPPTVTGTGKTYNPKYIMTKWSYSDHLGKGWVGILPHFYPLWNAQEVARPCAQHGGCRKK